MRAMSYILLGLMLGLTLVIYGQIYTPIPTTDAAWLDTWHSWIPSDPNWYEATYVENDTVISTTTYTKVVNRVDYYGTISEYYLGAIRNDVLNERVYFVPKDSLNEFLMYDFSVSLDDTLHNVYFNNTAVPDLGETHSVVVSEVDSFLIGANYHTRIGVRRIGAGYAGLSWFEGFGSSEGLLGTSAVGSVSNWKEFSCCKYSAQNYMAGFNSVSESTIQCITSLGVDKVRLLRIEIYPNPTNGEVKIEIHSLATKEHRIIITDLNGIIVVNEEHSESHYSVNLNNVPAGIYFIQIFDRANNVYSAKLVKE